ncbi:MAG: choice-of-anchor D domain-containing protein, partial [Bacteroidota bacterium]
MKKYLLMCLFWCVGAVFLVQAQQTEKGGQWTILETFEVPGKASGLAWDGQYIFFGQYSPNGDQIHRLDPETGNYEFVCNGPMEDAFGLTWDGEYLWSTDHPAAFDPGIAYQFDLSGNVNSQFECPATYMGGIEYDDGNFWLAAYYDPDGWIYKTDNQGTVLKDFATPGTQPWDICLQDEFLWIADYNDNMIYKVDTINGSLLESHPCENLKPAGITYDGQYLWYVDGPLGAASTIYKVDLGGAGTPEIEIPVTSWDFGNVAIGDSAVWAMNVMNTGTAELEIEGLQIMNSVPVFCWEAFPLTVAPGENQDIELVFRPTEVGSLNTTIQVLSNDPVNPEVDVELMGEAVIAGPAIHLVSTSHDYGDVRLNAMTRWFLQVQNIGDELLTVSDITIDDPAFFVDAGQT